MPGCQGLGGGLASGDDELQRRVETRPVAAGSGHEGLTSSSHEPRTRVVGAPSRGDVAVDQEPGGVVEDRQGARKVQWACQVHSGPGH